MVLQKMVIMLFVPAVIKGFAAIKDMLVKMAMITPADARKCVVAILEGADPAAVLSGQPIE